MTSPTHAATEAAPVPYHRRLATKIAMFGGACGVALAIATLLVAGLLASKHLKEAEQHNLERLAAAVGAELATVDDTDATTMARQIDLLASAVPDLMELRLSDAAGHELHAWRASTAASTQSMRLDLPAQHGQIRQLSLAVSRAHLDARMANMWLLLGLFLCGTVVLSFAGGWVLGRRLAAPVEAAARAARVVAEGRFDGGGIPVNSRDELAVLAESFNLMQSWLRELADKAQQVAHGDLQVDIDAVGELADAFRSMLESLRTLVRHIGRTSLQLNSATQEILATARGQENGAMDQSSAVEQTLRTLEGLRASGERIEGAAESVLSNAESTHQNNKRIGTRIGELTARTEQIGEILETIKGIANKSDLLALNAALEGTKAGEAGRGFSLVATQMQRLAENVMGAVQDIKNLTHEVQQASNATILVTEEGIKQAAEVTQSARQIGLIIRQQQTGIQQTLQAVHDISTVAQRTAEGASQTTAAVQDLVALSEQLQNQVEPFQMGRHALKSVAPPASVTAKRGAPEAASHIGERSDQP